MMEDEEKPFRFLNHSEFTALEGRAKLLYLHRAALELEDRQRLLREQMRAVAKDKKDE
jgi:hypothetical protein